jgi:hypothetical protein
MMKIARPKAPAGKENDRLQTVAGKGLEFLLRLCSSLEPWFDEIGRPGEIEEVK